MWIIFIVIVDNFLKYLDNLSNNINEEYKYTIIIDAKNLKKIESIILLIRLLIRLKINDIYTIKKRNMRLA